MFLAGPLQSVTNKMDASASRRFITLLFELGKRSFFLNIVTNLLFLIGVLYLVFFGFNNWWMVSGLIVFTVIKGVAKVVKLPIYKKAAASGISDEEWKRILKKMNRANMFQAFGTAIAAGIMLFSLF